MTGSWLWPWLQLYFHYNPPKWHRATLTMPGRCAWYWIRWGSQWLTKSMLGNSPPLVPLGERMESKWIVVALERISLVRFDLVLVGEPLQCCKIYLSGCPDWSLRWQRNDKSHTQRSGPRTAYPREFFNLLGFCIGPSPCPSCSFQEYDPPPPPPILLILPTDHVFIIAIAFEVMVVHVYPSPNMYTLQPSWRVHHFWLWALRINVWGLFIAQSRLQSYQQVAWLELVMSLDWQVMYLVGDLLFCT